MIKYKLLILFLILSKQNLNSQETFNNVVADTLIIKEETLATSDVVKVFNKTKASYYAQPYHGRKTASGEVYNMYDYTCAHRTLPFGTKVRVTNLKNNKSVVLRVNDRGPFVKGRTVDLSKQAYLDITHKKNIGILDVKLEILK